MPGRAVVKRYVAAAPTAAPVLKSACEPIAASCAHRGLIRFVLEGGRRVVDTLIALCRDEAPGLPATFIEQTEAAIAFGSGTQRGS